MAYYVVKGRTRKTSDRRSQRECRADLAGSEARPRCGVGIRADRTTLPEPIHCKGDGPCLLVAASELSDLAPGGCEQDVGQGLHNVVKVEPVERESMKGEGKDAWERCHMTDPARRQAPIVLLLSLLVISLVANAAWVALARARRWCCRRWLCSSSASGGWR